jgi:hypothetical protein
VSDEVVMIKGPVFLLLICSLLLIPVPWARAEASYAGKQEISHLLGYIQGSRCEFYRNGTWYRDMQVARDHAEQKYNYFDKKGRCNSAEEFITWAVTKSEISGKAYMVRCGSAPSIPTSQWLTEELQRYRQQELTTAGK